MTDSLVIKLGPRLDRETVSETLRRLHASVQERPARVVLDLAEVEGFDSAGMGSVVEGMRHARQIGVDVRLRGLSQSMLDFFSLLSVERLTRPGEAPERLDAVSRIGASVLPVLDMLAGIGRMAFRVAHGALVAPLRGKGLRLDRAVMEVDNAANGALPIVILISFLLGLVLAMQAYVQLRVWGAEIYVADMVAVSVVTEIGPLMTAIILAARSGSSNAAQLGSMVVGEEVDALLQMGVHPIRFLVVPKVLALAFAVLALSVAFDVVGMFGGALFAFAVADIHPAAYTEQTQSALHAVDFAVAMAKSLAFGLCVGVVGCALGLEVRGGSEGVGRATTNAVVLSIFLIIVIDTIFVTAQRMVLA